MRVNTEVEKSRWEPIEGTPKEGAKLCFIDGVMREEADLPEKLVISFSAGALLLERGRVNRWEESLICYKFRQAVELAKEKTDIQEEAYRILSELEYEVLEEVKDLRCDLLIKDGRLTKACTDPACPIGLIKDLQKLYIPQDKREIFKELKPGMRTPIFLIQGGDGLDRFSWFVMLGKTNNSTGMVRLEVDAGVGIEKATKMASLSAGLLPIYSSDPLRDSRAPQNLLPIGWLEKRLRSLIGDSRLIRRTLLTSQGPQ